MELSDNEMNLMINQIVNTAIFGGIGNITRKKIKQMSMISYQDMSKRSCWSRWFGPLSSLTFIR